MVPAQSFLFEGLNKFSFEIRPCFPNFPNFTLKLVLQNLQFVFVFKEFSSISMNNKHDVNNLQ